LAQQLDRMRLPVTARGRLEYLLIPLVFGLGASLVALVGTNIGAGQEPVWAGDTRSSAASRAHDP
jgi:hypothetical protein